MSLYFFATINSRLAVYSKIDWVFRNLQWLNSYGHVEVEILVPGVSDHSNQIIQISPQPYMRPRPFKHLKTVLNHHEFGSVLRRN